MSITTRVNDGKAFLRSTAATVAGIAASVATLAAGAVAFIPDEYASVTGAIITVGVIAGIVGGAARQLYAWLDPGNTSFGRVALPEGEELVDVTSPEAIEEYLESIQDTAVDETLLPDEHTTAEGAETQPEPKGI